MLQQLRTRSSKISATASPRYTQLKMNELCAKESVKTLKIARNPAHPRLHTKHQQIVTTNEAKSTKRKLVMAKRNVKRAVSDNGYFVQSRPAKYGTPNMKSMKAKAKVAFKNRKASFLTFLKWPVFLNVSDLIKSV